MPPSAGESDLPGEDLCGRDDGTELTWHVLIGSTIAPEAQSSLSNLEMCLEIQKAMQAGS